MEIDFTYSDLAEDEIAEYRQRMERQAKEDAERDRKRWQRAREFRFVGGMV